MGKYSALYLEGVKKFSAYRLVVSAQFISTILYLVLLTAVWTAISKAGNLQGGLSRVISYVILGQVINRSVGTGIEDWYGTRIRRGTITNEIKRPVSVLTNSFLHDMGWRSMSLLLMSIPLLVGGIAFGGIQIPSVPTLVAFSATWLTSMVLMTAIGLSTSMLVFWTKTDSGIRFTRSTIISFMSGVTFPLYLLPEQLKEIFFLFPFHLIVDGPINIFLGRRTLKEAIWILGQQWLWIFFFTATTVLLWKIARKKLTVQGG